MSLIFIFKPLTFKSSSSSSELIINASHHHHRLVKKKNLPSKLMLRSFWRSFDRFSLQHFQHIIDELQAIKDVDTFNREVVVDLLQSVVEVVSYGDKHEPLIFECFMDRQVLADFVRMLKISKSSRIQAKVLQYMSILIQNLQSEHALYYCFSNGYINDVITHEYDFHDGDLVLFYVSFLRAVSWKLNRDTICLLLGVEGRMVTSFPLYTEALRFAHHGDKMIQIAIRSLTLNVYNVSDDVVYQFLMTPPASEYFSDLVLKLKEECVHLDASVCSMRKREDLISGTDKILDHLYYLKDLINVGKSCLTNLVTEKLLGLLVVPIMMQLMKLGEIEGVHISAVTSMYFISRLLQVLEKKEILESVACLILYAHVALDNGRVIESTSVDSCQVNPTFDHLNKIESALCSSLGSQEVGLEKVLGQALGDKLLPHHSNGFQRNNVVERNGIFSYVCSDELGLPQAALMLFLILAESDLDNLLASAFSFPETYSETDDAEVLERAKLSIFFECMPQILNVLFGLLESTPPCPVTQWQVGWFILQLIKLQVSTFNHQQLHLFNVSIQLNALLHQARERLLTELGGCWFDHIPETFEKEWAMCGKALKASPKIKDPFFVLEIAIGKQSATGNGVDNWQKMVAAVKILVLHLQLKAFVLKGCLPDCPLRNSLSSSVADPRNGRNSDFLSASFGSEVSLASGVPCTIAFSKFGLRNIYMIPVAKDNSGKLLLVEKHPFHSRRGIVFASAPLSGLNPRIDEAQATWLHLHVRDLTPELSIKKGTTKSTSFQTAAKWSLGFSDAETCEAARLQIVEETCKQRAFVESLLAPFLYDNYLGD